MPEPWQPSLPFQAPPPVREAPPRPAPPEPVEYPTEGSRQREQRVLRALAERPGDAEDVIRRAGLRQAEGCAELRLMTDAGLIEQVVVYRLPGRRVEVR